MAITTQLIKGIEFVGDHFVAAPAALFILMVAFSYLIFHQTTYKEETSFLEGQKLLVAELEVVESSQERRSRQEREEEQSITDSSDDEYEERPAKRARLEEEPTIRDIVERQLGEYEARTHLVTFAATDAEANFIFKYVPQARYLISLDAEESHDHITEIRYERLRRHSAPADICT